MFFKTIPKCAGEEENVICRKFILDILIIVAVAVIANQLFK